MQPLRGRWSRVILSLKASGAMAAVRVATVENHVREDSKVK
jgi:hypothetical protein